LSCAALSRGRGKGFLKARFGRRFPFLFHPFLEMTQARIYEVPSERDQRGRFSQLEEGESFIDLDSGPQ
jgi:hypothetical protein